MLDLVIEGGTVVDGTGAPGRRADVGIESDVIVAIDDLRHVPADRVDAGGMVVAPGFVDVHSHSDFTLLVDGRAQSQIFQGVTTELLGNCGHGCAPLTDPELFTANIYGYEPVVDLDWSSVDGYLSRLEGADPAVNVAMLVPNGNLRICAVADLGRPATPEELKEMRRLLSEGLEMGAYGLSTGLEYPWEREASEAEIIELCSVVAAAGGLYATHERDKDRRAVEAIEEAVRASEGSGVRLQVSHIIPRRGAPEGALEQVILLVEEAHAGGLDAQFDAHTRTYGILNLSAVLPPWALQGGPDALARRLRDPISRAEMKRYDSIVSVKKHAGWNRVFLFSCDASPEKVGKSFAELTTGGGDVFDAMYEILLDEGDTPHRPMIITHSYDEEMLRTTFVHPLCTTGSDATALCVDGPLRDTSFLGAYTWAGWYFRSMVTEWGDLTVEDAIHRLTAQAAERIGLSDRGLLAKGFKADVIVFDPARFKEKGTLDAPNQPAEGIEHVFVNGGHTLKDGELTPDRFGEVLRRT